MPNNREAFSHFLARSSPHKVFKHCEEIIWHDNINTQPPTDVAPYTISKIAGQKQVGDHLLLTQTVTTVHTTPIHLNTTQSKDSSLKEFDPKTPSKRKQSPLTVPSFSKYSSRLSIHWGQNMTPPQKYHQEVYTPNSP
jgi:hypothetical protein